MRFHLQRVGRAHERIVGIGHRPDCPLGRELPQPVDRIGDVPIFLKPGAVEIDRDVAAQQVFWPRRRGDSVIMRVAAAERVLATYDLSGVYRLGYIGLGSRGGGRRMTWSMWVAVFVLVIGLAGLVSCFWDILRGPPHPPL
jgi:hypothetical protein